MSVAPPVPIVPAITSPLIWCFSRSSWPPVTSMSLRGRASPSPAGFSTVSTLILTGIRRLSISIERNVRLR